MKKAIRVLCVLLTVVLASGQPQAASAQVPGIIAAQRAQERAEALYEEGTAEALRNALKFCQDAQDRWGALGGKRACAVRYPEG